MKTLLIVLALFSSLNASAYETPFAKMRTKITITDDQGRKKECFKNHKHTVSFVGRSMKSALERSLNKWEIYTGVEYGTDWDEFFHATEQTTNCKPFTRFFHKCKVTAKPCRYLKD